LGKDDQQLPGKEPVVYEKYSCKITLPGERWRWFEAPDLEKGDGFIVHDSMANVILKIMPAEDDKLTDTFAQNFEKGVLMGTGGKKIGSRRITYKGRPCYELAASVSTFDMETTTRVLVVGGFSYSLAVSIPSKAARLVSASDVFERCFEFTETIEPDKSQGVDSESGSKPGSQAPGGWLLWGGLAVLIGGAGVLILFIQKRKKA
jgi:hypothetical protein